MKLEERIRQLAPEERPAFERQAWLTGTLVFALCMIALIFKDGVVDQPKVVMSLVVLALVSGLLRLFIRREVARLAR